MEQSLTLSPIRQKSKQGRPKTIKTEIDETPDTVELDLGFTIERNKTYIFETINKSNIARLENLGSRTKLYDVHEKRYREIGYHPLTTSIFTEYWDESFLELPQIPLFFNRNSIEVLGEDIRKMEYMMCHNLYENSPYRILNRPAMFKLADKEVLENIKAKKHAIEKKALDAISETEISDLKPIARIIFGITESSDTAIINAMNELVKHSKQGMEKSNAEKILDNINNPKLQKTYNIQSAIDKGIITIDNNKGAAFLSDNNSLIINLDTRNAIKELVDYTFTDAGKEFYSILRSKV